MGDKSNNNDVNKKLDDILATCNNTQVDMQRLSTRVDSIWESITASLANIESEVSAIKIEVSTVREQMTRLSNDLAAAVSRIQALENNAQHSNTVATAVQTQVNEMKTEMNGLQQLMLANDFVIHGLPPSSDANQAMNAVTKLGNFVGVSLTAQDFSRQPFAIVNKSKTLITVIGSFKNHQMKRNLFEACKQRRPIPVEDIVDVGASSPLRGKEVRIKNSLTPWNREILAEALRTKGDYFKFAFDIDGRPFLRKAEGSPRIELKSLDDLRRIIAAARNSS